MLICIKCCLLATLLIFMLITSYRPCLDLLGSFKCSVVVAVAFQLPVEGQGVTPRSFELVWWHVYTHKCTNTFLENEIAKENHKSSRPYINVEWIRQTQSTCSPVQKHVFQTLTLSTLMTKSWFYVHMISGQSYKVRLNAFWYVIFFCRINIVIPCLTHLMRYQLSVSLWEKIDFSCNYKFSCF